MNDADLLAGRQRRRRAELDRWADEQMAAPPENRPQYLDPIGPRPPDGGMPPTPGLLSRGASAVGGALHEGALRGGQAGAEGLRHIRDGLLKVISPIRVATEADQFGEWSARMKGMKQIVDGLFAFGLSPAIAASGAVGAGVDAAAPGALDTPVLDPLLSGFIRTMMGGGDPNNPRAAQAPMTGRELLDLVGGALFIGGLHVAGKGGKAGGGEPAPATGGPRATPPGALPGARPAEALPPPGPRRGATTVTQIAGELPETAASLRPRGTTVTEIRPAGPAALEGREPQRALPPAPAGTPIDLGPSSLTPAERFAIIERLREEGKLEPLRQAYEAAQQRAQLPRGGTGEPTPIVQGRPAPVEPGRLVDPSGRPAPSVTPSMAEREYLRARERTPLSAERRATGEGEAPARTVAGGEARTSEQVIAARLERIYGPDLASAGGAVERAVAETLSKWPPEDQGFAKFSAAFAEVARAAEVEREPARAISGGAPLVLSRQDVLGTMYTELQNATAGSKTRVVERIAGKGKRETWVSSPSTYPEFMNEIGVARTRKGADKAMKAIDEVFNAAPDAELSPLAKRILQRADSEAEGLNRLEEGRAAERRREAAELRADDATVAKELGLLEGEEGRVSLSTVTLLAKMALGGLVGGSTGDTPEERLRNALAGMGLGALLSQRLAASVIRAVRHPRVLATLRDESGVIRIPNFSKIEASEKVKAFMREMAQDEGFQKEIERQARGVRSWDETSKAALALIKSKKFRAQMVLDAEPGTIWNAEQATAARMLTQAANNQAYRVAVEVKAGRDTLANLNASLAVAMRMTTNTHAVMTEEGRALHALGRSVSGDVPVKISPERLAEEAARMPRDERLPDMVIAMAEEHGLEGVGRLARFRHALPDAMLEYYYGAALLSNPMTQVRNIVGNTMALATMMVERQAAGVLGLNPFRNPAKTHVSMGENAHGAIAMLETLGDSLRMAARAAREGTNVTKLDSPLREPALTAERLGFDPHTPWGLFLDYVGKYARMNLKMLEGEDTFFRLMNFQYYRRARALRQAEFEGAAGEAKATRIAELWRDPPEWLLQEAWKFSADQTFSRSFEGRMASLQDALSHPLTKVAALPFFRTPLRLGEWGATHTPVLNLIIPESRRALRAGGAAAELELSKLGVGAAISTAFGYLAWQGFITGSPPKDHEERRRQEEAGVKWKSAYNPATGAYVSYDNLEPVSTLVAMSADLVAALKKLPNWDDLPTVALQATTAMVLSSARHLQEKQYLQSVGQFLEALQNPNTAGALKLLQRRMASWVPAIVGQAERIYDPVFRETETLIDEFRAKIPGLSGDMVPRRNIITGEPLEHAGIMGQRSKDPVLDEIRRLDGAGIRAPVASLAGRRPSRAPIMMEEPDPAAGVPLNARQYDRLILLMTREKIAGQTLHETLAATIASEHYKRQSEGQDGGKALELRSIVQAFAQEAKGKLSEEMGGVIEAKRAERERRRTPPDQLAPSLGR